MPATRGRRTSMTTAVIYARFSTDKQRETSVDDQAQVCRKRAEELGIVVTAVHADNGISGSTLVDSRPGGRALLADAIAARFDILILEGLDRLSRDRVEQETIVRRLEHRGLRIIGISDGYDTSSGKGRTLLRGMRGLINEIFLDDLRDKTHRGLNGQVGRGFHAGGLSFGYCSIEKVGGHLLQINPDQAKWVHWIFHRYGEGWSTKRIAHALNREHVPSARGSTWCASAIHGRPDRGSGVLNNELYIGRYIWNRSQWLKDPDTKKRERRGRPRSEWQVIERPDLRIVDDETWNMAQRRIHTPRARGGGQGCGPKPRTLFGGLIRCEACGGAVTAVDAAHYGCSANKERGPAVCTGVRVRRDVFEARILSQLRDQLMSPAAIAEFQAEMTRLAREERVALPIACSTRATRSAAWDREIGNLVQAIADVGISPSLKAKLLDAEQERAELRRARSGPAPHRDVKAAMDGYRRMVMHLQDELRADVGRARAALAEVFGEIRLSRVGEEIWAEAETRTDHLLRVAGGTSNSGCGGRI